MRQLLLIATIACLPLFSAQAAILALITNVTDLTIPNWSLGDPAVNAHIDLCVYSTVTADYGVKVNQTGGYNLKNGTASIPYSLSWDDGGVGNLGLSATSLTNNVRIGNRQRANLVSPVCLTGPNARLNLDITQAAMQAAMSGSYSASIDIIVSAN